MPIICGGVYVTEDEEKKDARYNIHDDEIVSHPVENVKKGAVDDTSAKHEQTSPGITLNISNNSTGGSVNNSNFARNQGAGFGAGYNAHDNAHVDHIGEANQTYSSGNQDEMYSRIEDMLNKLNRDRAPMPGEPSGSSQYTGKHEDRRDLPEHNIRGLIAEKADSGHTMEHYDDTVSEKKKDYTGNGGGEGKGKRDLKVTKTGTGVGGLPAVTESKNDTGSKGKNADIVPYTTGELREIGNRSGGGTGEHPALEGPVVDLDPNQWEKIESYIGSKDGAVLTGKGKEKMVTEGKGGKQYVPESEKRGALAGRGKQYELESGEHAVAGLLPEESATGQEKEAFGAMCDELDSKGYFQITSLLWTKGKGITFDDISNKDASGVGEMCVNRTIEDMTQDSKKYNTSLTKNLYNAAKNIAKSEESGSARQAAEKLENACVVQTAKNALKEGYRPRSPGSGTHPTKGMDGKDGKNEELKRDIGDDMYNSVAGVLDLVKDTEGYRKVTKLQTDVNKKGYKSRDNKTVNEVNEIIKEYQPLIDGLKTLNPKGELKDLKAGVKKAYESITAFRGDIGKGYVPKTKSK